MVIGTDMQHVAATPMSNAEFSSDGAAAAVAAAIGEPARARMLYCLLDGHARTSTELAIVGEVGASTASAHLSRLMERRLVSLTSQGKLQGLIVGSLPLFLMLVLSHIQHAAMAPLFNTPIGWGVLAIIGILELMGFFVIRKIVSIDV